MRTVTASTYGDADEIDAHEKEIDVRTDRIDADRPDLCYDNGTDSSPRRREVESTRSNRSRKYLELVLKCLILDSVRDFSMSYLGAVYPCRWSETHTIAKSIDEDENDANHVGGPVCIVWINLAQHTIDLGIIDIS